VIRRCPTCKGEFKTRDSRQKNCSEWCRNVSSQRIDDARLCVLALRGMTLAEMAQEFNVTAEGVRAAIRRCGLRDVWREQRFA
jgi:hypothetical protein